MEDSMLDIVREEHAERGLYIRDDVDAERALLKLQALRKEREQLLTEYKARMEKIQQRFDNDIQSVEFILQDYFGRVPHRKTKTMESYQLANGKISVKHQAPEYKFDKPCLVKWLKANAKEYVKTVEEPDWVNFKKLVAMDGLNVVLKDTGEYVPGVVAEQREDKFVVSIKDGEADG